MFARDMASAVVSDPRPLPDLGDAATRARLTPAALSAMVQIADAWKLRAKDACRLMGDVSERSWFRMKKGECEAQALTQDQLMRASAVLGIYKGLHLLFVDDLADRWPSLANAGPPFAGETPIVYALRGGIPALLEVRQHVDGLRGGL